MHSYTNRNTGRKVTSAYGTLMGLLLLIFAATPAYADYTYELVSYPGAVDTEVFGINDKGMVAGTASLTGATGSYFGFVYDSKRGTYTMITELDGVLAINNRGVIVGNVTDGSGFVACAIRERNGDVSLFYPPSFANVVDPNVDGCQARAINSSGRVTGFLASNSGVDWVGFVYDPKKGTIDEFLPSPSTIAQGINKKGEIVGSVSLDADDAYPGSPAGIYGFLRDKRGNIKYFTVNDLTTTRGRGISDRGEITGFFTEQFFGMAFGRGFVITLSNSPGFENIDLTPEQRLLPEPCNTVMPLPLDDWTRATNLYGQAINSRGVAAGFCNEYDLLFNPPGDPSGTLINFIGYDGVGFIATPD